MFTSNNNTASWSTF